MGPMAGFLMVCTAGFQVGNLGDRLMVLAYSYFLNIVCFHVIDVE